MIIATVALVTWPFAIFLNVAGITGGVAVISVVSGLWTFVLEVMLVMAASDISAIAAWALLFAANIIARFVTQAAAAVMQGAI
jgi:hypothetical protein